MIDFITQWWNDKFRKVDPDRISALTTATFNCAAGRELLKFWVDEINMSPPYTIDSHEITHWKAQCKFVADIVKMVDAAEHPDKWRQEQMKPRHVVGGQIGGTRNTTGW